MYAYIYDVLDVQSNIIEFCYYVPCNVELRAAGYKSSTMVLLGTTMLKKFVMLVLNIRMV
jgi:hypothetical protein